MEEELLKIIAEYPKEAYDQVIAERKNWDVLYHLSHIRENLVEWLPISKEETVLEIGSECGAITGILSRKAARVECIERSEKRSRINALRHKERENITIKTGDFTEIEAGLTEAFDWVTMVGVLANAPEYVDSKSPYQDFLKKAAAHLKPGGKVVLAIPNRLGMKYFSGCREDQTGVVFEGIEDYRTTEGVRTFSKPELEKLMTEAGFRKWEFYYPYPDYRFPMSIYSDEYLPKLGELRTNDNNFDGKRLLVFDEGSAFDGVIESRMFPQFSNSFLVVMEKEARDV